MEYEGPEFVVLKKVGQVPALAGCTRCGRKFFTPSTPLKDEIEAENYLLEKFSYHTCQLSEQKERGKSDTRWAIRR
jgi:hypothetical protein